MPDFKNGKIIVFSGAGISAESGIATFRDSDGLWAKHDPNTICNYRNWESNYELVHSFYNKRRKELESKLPNPAHKLIKRLEDEFGIINITQNIDNLFEKAGCKNVVHLHGELTSLRCIRCECIIEIGYKAYDFSPCPKCGAERLKPNVVFFYENAPKYAELYTIFNNICDDDIVLVIGTSGEVVNICYLLNKGYKILNNLEKCPSIDENIFDSVYYRNASVALPLIYEEIKRLKG
ncbi:hypothetical protein CCY99_04360 [Helicobacter sp. 16-1353]|uniref:SIR2 family NAD-dependent protein deacylase n=1 Tax=Helicobacter sp. 16-1353 TaxID=2004996 RepID=UPI000DCF4A88|nr:Sir2 family NAD-dependent protein deacetylase [Helicobacter sp. 16-1353]RAX54250.1 hypothetical protein CCY99_04360 [Helicobacter sp. 16-1353]